jgi:hypothetical protein
VRSWGVRKGIRTEEIFFSPLSHLRSHLRPSFPAFSTSVIHVSPSKLQTSSPIPSAWHRYRSVVGSRTSPLSASFHSLFSPKQKRNEQRREIIKPGKFTNKSTIRILLCKRVTALKLTWLHEAENKHCHSVAQTKDVKMVVFRCPRIAWQLQTPNRFPSVKQGLILG